MAPYKQETIVEQNRTTCISTAQGRVAGTTITRKIEAQDISILVP